MNRISIRVFNRLVLLAFAFHALPAVAQKNACAVSVRMFEEGKAPPTDRPVLHSDTATVIRPLVPLRLQAELANRGDANVEVFFEGVGLELGENLGGKVSLKPGEARTLKFSVSDKAPESCRPGSRAVRASVKAERQECGVVEKYFYCE